MGSSWAVSTKETYGAGLLVFHVYCDTLNIPEMKCCPVSLSLLLAFLSSYAGSYGAAGLKAWHLLHGQPWYVQANELKATLDGATALALPSSKRQKRELFTPAIIISLCQLLDLNDPRDAAVFTCLTTTFYSIACLSEFTVPAINAFSPTKHITHAHVSEVTDRNGLPVMKFHLPSMKSSPTEGEDTFWSEQQGLSDPKATLNNHFCINNPSALAHLFSWNHPNAAQALSRKELLTRISAISTSINLPNVKGHSLWIRETLEFLLRGIPFDVVKSMGRWSSEAFTIYLCQHAMILAPYIQHHEKGYWLFMVIYLFLCLNSI